MWKKGKPVLATILMIACMAVVAADLFSVRAVADNGNLIQPQYANPYLSAEGNLLYVDVAEKVWNVIEARITFDEEKGTAQAREHDAFRKAVEDQKMIYNFAYNDTTPGLIRIAGAFAGHDTDDPLEYSGHVLVIRFEESQLPVEVTMNGQTVVVGGEASVPSEAPTGAPTEEPTGAPTEGPTGEPAQGPTEGPTEEPTGEPTQGSTERPTEEPTEEPTGTPTEEPTGEPTQGPTEGPSETPTEVPDREVVYGDLDENGEINTSDALMILKIVVKLEMPTETQRQAADVDNSGAVDTADALAVLKKVVKLIERFPAEEAEPSEQPESTEEPTGEPTEGSTEEPTGDSTEEPAEGPTGEPTEGPTEEPTGEPTEGSTEEPTGEPTEGSTEEPSGDSSEGLAEGGQL